MFFDSHSSRKAYSKKRNYKRKRSLGNITPSKENRPIKKRGRRPIRSLKKPNLKIVIDICGYKNLMAAIGVEKCTISNWLYREDKVPLPYTKIMSNLTLGIVKAKDINYQLIPI